MAKFDTKMGVKCLGDEILEAIWNGVDVHLPEGLSEAKRIEFAERWFADKYCDLSEKMPEQHYKSNGCKSGKGTRDDHG